MSEIQELADLLPSEVCEGESPPCLFASSEGFSGTLWHVLACSKITLISSSSCGVLLV